MIRLATTFFVMLAVSGVSSSHAYCLYNKTSSLTIQFAVTDSAGAWTNNTGTGTPYSAKSGTNLLPNAAPGAIPNGGRNAPFAMRSLTANDKYLKPSESFCCKQGDKNCPVTFAKTLDVALEIKLSNPQKHPRCGSAENQTAVKLLTDGYLLIRHARFDTTKPLSQQNAPVAIDSMSADGRLLQTFYCPVSMGSGVNSLSANDFK